jgi:hypothetical protein
LGGRFGEKGAAREDGLEEVEGVMRVGNSSSNGIVQERRDSSKVVGMRGGSKL